jgi:putative phosphoesterase
VRDAVLFDIHGNLDALEAVLRAADAAGCEQLYIGGDLAYMGPDPEAVVDRLRAEGERVIAVRGNTDRMIAGGDDDVARWAADRLGPERVAYLEGLPAARRLPAHDALMVHATPRSDEERLLPDTPEVVAAAMTADVAARTLLCGHVHIQYRRPVGSVEIVNPGSVGIPFDGDPRAAWAVIEDGDVLLQRTDYDQAGALARLGTLTSHPERALAERRLRDARP